MDEEKQTFVRNFTQAVNDVYFLGYGYADLIHQPGYDDGVKYANSDIPLEEFNGSDADYAKKASDIYDSYEKEEAKSEQPLPTPLQLARRCRPRV